MRQRHICLMKIKCETVDSPHQIRILQFANQIYNLYVSNRFVYLSNLISLKHNIQLSCCFYSYVEPKMIISNEGPNIPNNSSTTTEVHRQDFIESKKLNRIHSVQFWHGKQSAARTQLKLIFPNANPQRKHNETWIVVYVCVYGVRRRVQISSISISLVVIVCFERRTMNVCMHSNVYLCVCMF